MFFKKVLITAILCTLLTGCATDDGYEIPQEVKDIASDVVSEVINEGSENLDTKDIATKYLLTKKEWVKQKVHDVFEFLEDKVFAWINDVDEEDFENNNSSEELEAIIEYAE